MRKTALALAIVTALLLTRSPSEAQTGGQLTTVPRQPEQTTTTFVITTFPTIVPTLPPFTTVPPPTRPPPTTAPTTAPPSTAPPTAPPTTDPPPPPPTAPPATFPPATARPTVPPTTAPPPIPEPPPAVAAPPPGPAPAVPALPAGAGMVSDKVASEPGGVVTLTGGGCTPEGDVTVQVGDRMIGTIVATPEGKFIAILTLPQMIAVGRYDIVVTCGVVHTAPIDIVVTTNLDSGESVLALFIFFVLICIALWRRRRLVPPGGKGDPQPEPL